MGWHLKSTTPSPPHAVKEESQSPPRFCVQQKPASPPRRNCRDQVVKEELLPTIAKARRSILHYLGSGGSSSPQAMVSAVDRAVRQATQHDPPLCFRKVG